MDRQFVQDNRVYSQSTVCADSISGRHRMPLGKLVRCIRAAILDVAVDIASEIEAQLRLGRPRDDGNGHSKKPFNGISSALIGGHHSERELLHQ